MRYNITRQLNSGAFGIVYEILGDDNMVYALKELKDLDEIHKQRFQREIAILAQLNHPNIVKIFRWNIGGDPPNFSPYYIMESKPLVLSVLISIVLTGLVGIPFGDPRFIPIAILLELVFIGMAIAVLKGYTRSLYICIVLASLIIIGNSVTTAHIHRMMTFAKPVNTIVLIIGGYVLQALLIYSCAHAILDKRREDSSRNNKAMTASHH